MRRVAARGRWLWGVSGVVTVVALAIPGTRLITNAGVPGNQYAHPSRIFTGTFTVPQPVTSLGVQSYGGLVRVTAGPVRRVQVAETIQYDPHEGGLPAVTHSVSAGRLTLADPACNVSDCFVSFTVTVPRGVAVTAASEGGPVIVSGIAGANLDSGSGPVWATGIDGPLTVTSGGGTVTVSGGAGANLDSGGGSVRATGIGGPLTVSTEGGWLALDGLTGPLHADTAGGFLLAENVASATATAVTGGGPAYIGFTAAPDTVVVSTDGGPATVEVPRGPYALNADSGGGSQMVGITADPAARRTITVTSGGGPLDIGFTGTRQPPAPAMPSAPPIPSAPMLIPLPPVPPVPPVQQAQPVQQVQPAQQVHARPVPAAPLG